MTSIQHKELALGKWSSLSFAEQFANIGSEVERAISWRQKKNVVYSNLALNRALELLDLTLALRLEYSKLKELARLREILIDNFYEDNMYESTDESLKKYFYAFAYAAAIKKLV